MRKKSVCLIYTHGGSVTELETLPHYRGREIAGRCIGSWWKRRLVEISQPRFIDRGEVSKLDSCYFEHTNIIHGRGCIIHGCYLLSATTTLVFREINVSDFSMNGLLHSREGDGLHNFNLRIIGGSRISRWIRRFPFKRIRFLRIS